MKHLSFLLLVGLCGLLVTSCADNQHPNEESRPAYKPKYTPEVSEVQAAKRADTLLAKMSLEQKADYVKGYRHFFIRPYEELGIPLLYLTDATQGVHIRKKLAREIFTQMDSSTAFPAPIMLAATWDTSLSARYGTAVGNECREGGIHVLLGPGFNLYRNPECGRNFEYFGEDPYLTSRMIENYLVAVQNTGTMATLKHFLANNSETYRKWNNNVVDERTLHELYLRPFQAGIDAGVLAVMTAYNQVNGEWVGESEYFIKQLLREEMGFGGMVMTDWGSVWNPEALIHSGQNLEMPLGRFLDSLYAHTDDLSTYEPQLDEMVHYVLKASIMMGLYDRPQRVTKGAETFRNSGKIAYETAQEGTILLKNEKGLLPLDNEQRILLTGRFADTIPAGIGSAQVEGYGHVTLWEALQTLSDHVILEKNPTRDQLAAADVVIVATGCIDGESFNRPFALPEPMATEIQQAVENNPNTVLMLSAGGGIDMSAFADQASAILYSWYPGQNGAQAQAEILYGTLNPSGKLPISIEQDIAHSPAYGKMGAGDPASWGYPDGTIYPEGHPQKDIYTLTYTEGLNIGYKFLEHEGHTPQFPFGFGLSYTSFAIEGLKADTTGFAQTGRIDFRTTLTNTGERAGKEVVQLYVSIEHGSVAFPPKSLVGFQKVALEPGASTSVVLSVEAADLMYWNTDSQQFQLDEAAYTFRVGNSSANVTAAKTLTLK